MISPYIVERTFYSLLISLETSEWTAKLHITLSSFECSELRESQSKSKSGFQTQIIKQYVT